MCIYIADTSDKMFDFVLDYDHKEFMAELRQNDNAPLANARWGKANGMYGKRHSKELQEYVNNKNSLEYILIHPNGTQEKIRNLNKYCNNNGLNRSSLLRVLDTGNSVPYPKSKRKPTEAAFATVGYKISRI